MDQTEEAPGLDAHAETVRRRVRELFGRSLHIRHVDAGSCNGCELELHALTNPYYDINRLGIFFTTSPRHADMLLATGPVTRNMAIPLQAAYDAMPDPKLVVAAGTCACSGGLYRFPSYASATGLDSFLPVDVYIPGNPPSPLALIQGILLALERVGQKVRARTVEVPSPSGGQQTDAIRG